MTRKSSPWQRPKVPQIDSQYGRSIGGKPPVPTGQKTDDTVSRPAPPRTPTGQGGIVRPTAPRRIGTSRRITPQMSLLTLGKWKLVIATLAFVVTVGGALVFFGNSGSSDVNSTDSVPNSQGVSRDSSPSQDDSPDRKSVV